MLHRLLLLLSLDHHIGLAQGPAGGVVHQAAVAVLLLVVLAHRMPRNPAVVALEEDSLHILLLLVLLMLPLLQLLMHHCWEEVRRTCEVHLDNRQCEVISAYEKHLEYAKGCISVRC